MYGITAMPPTLPLTKAPKVKTLNSKKKVRLTWGSLAAAVSQSCESKYNDVCSISFFILEQRQEKEEQKEEEQLNTILIV